MATYSRLGSYLLSGELTNDPIGRIHRGIVLVGDKFDRHVLVRTFFEELVQAGIGGKMGEAGKAIPQLGGSKAFGVGYRLEGGAQPHVVCDYVPGRSLAQLLAKAKLEQIPFGVDHALSVMQGIAQGLIQLHGKGLHHGLLSPHSVWVSFEGATHILDAPFAGQIRALLPKAPVTQTSLEAYVREAGAGPLQQDFFGLGAILYEMLTLERLPVGGDLGTLVSRATLKAAQEDTPVPAEIQGLLGRLLGVGQPFGSANEFNAEMERVLYDGDYSPTTFNMAFFMHTLFREENDTDTQGMKTEVSDDYAAYAMVAAEAAAGGRQREPLVAGETEAQKSKKMLIGVVAVAVAAIGGLSFFALRKDPKMVEMERQVAELQRIKAEMEVQKANLESQSKDTAAKVAEKEKAVQEAKTAADREKAAKELEAEKKKQADLEKQKQELEAKRRQTEQKVAQVAATVPTAVPAPAPKPEPPKVEAPKPEPPKVEAPKPEPPKPEAPKPEPPKPAVTAAPAPVAPSAPVQEVAPQVVTRVAPALPPRAKTVFQYKGKTVVVSLRVFVDATGRPQKVQFLSSDEGPLASLFNEEAEKAALASKFQAGSRDGRPVSGWVPMNFNFAVPR